MKKEIHPDYNYVVFKDASSDFAILTRSTKSSEDKIKWEDGKEYPLITVEISSGSHSIYTGRDKSYEKEGRVERFRKKYSKKKKEEETTEDTE